MEEKSSGFQPGRGRQLGRRRFIGSLALTGAGLAAAGLVACRAETPAAAPSGGTRPPVRGGTLRRRSTSEVFNGGMDPHIQPGSQTGEMGLFYQGLVRLNQRDFTLEPELAQRWEQPSQTEVLLTLARGVRWHNKPPANGRAFTADDAVYSLERIRSPEPRFASRSLLDSIDRIEAVSQDSVRLRLKRPDATVMSNLAAFSLKMLAPEVVENAGRFNSAEATVGTGAFIFQTKDDVSGLAVRNPDYWKPGLPYLDAVRLSAINDDQAAWSAFLAGGLDVVLVPGNESKKVSADQTRKYSAEWLKEVSFTGLQPNLQVKPFDDARVTKGLRLLVDHQEAVTAWAEAWFGRGYVSIAFPAALSDWDLTEEEYARHIEFKQPKDDAIRQSLTLLAAAGFTRDSPLVFPLNAQGGDGFSVSRAELLNAQFKRNSQNIVQTEIRFFPDPATARSALARGDFNYTIAALVAGQPFEPDDWFQTFYRTGGSRNYGKYSDRTLDQLIDRQKTIFDSGQRRTAIREILLSLLENSPYTSWSGRYTLSAFHPQVNNWAPEAISATWGHQYEQVWLDA